MANPFQVKFDSECQECGSIVDQGENMFADDGMFICEPCAEELGVICSCGNYKKPEYDTCYNCKDDKYEGFGGDIPY